MKENKSKLVYASEYLNDKFIKKTGKSFKAYVVTNLTEMVLNEDNFDTLTLSDRLDALYLLDCCYDQNDGFYIEEEDDNTN